MPAFMIQKTAQRADYQKIVNRSLCCNECCRECKVEVPILSHISSLSASANLPESCFIDL